jgi:hypothetical protein
MQTIDVNQHNRGPEDLSAAVVLAEKDGYSLQAQATKLRATNLTGLL